MEKTECVDYIKQAFELKESQNYKVAIELLYKALELENDNVEILFQLGELYFLLNNYSRARQYISKVLQISPEHLNALQLAKTINEREGNDTKVLEFAKILFEKHPSSQTLNELLKVMINLKMFAQTEQYQNSEYFTPEVKLDCANALYDANEKEKAKALLSECDMKDEKAILLSGKIKFDENKIEESKEIFSQIKNSQNPEVLNYKGLFELENMNFIEAIKDFSKAISIDKTNSRYFYNLGNAYFYNGWMEEAQKAYRNALLITPENLDYRYSLAYLYYAEKEFTKAEKETNAIIDIMPLHSQARVLRALLLENKKEYIKAQEILEENLKNGYDDDFTKSSLSRIYAELSNFGKAETLISEILDKNPENLSYITDLADIYIKERNYDGALALVQRSLEINPNYISGHIMGAKIAGLKGDYVQSKDFAQEALSLDISCPEGYYYIALAREHEGDIDEAVECMKRAILYDLNNSEYYRKMCELYQLKKDYKTALEYITEAENINPSNEYKYIYSELVKINRKLKP